MSISPIPLAIGNKDFSISPDQIPSFAYPVGRIFSELDSPTPSFYGFKIEKLSTLQKRLNRADETQKSEKIQALLWIALKVILLSGAIAGFVLCPIAGMTLFGALVVCNLAAFHISETQREMDDRSRSNPRYCYYGIKATVAGMPILAHTLFTRKNALQKNISKNESEILEMARNIEKDYPRFKAQLEQKQSGPSPSNWNSADLAKALEELEKAHRLAQLLLNQEVSSQTH